jgi:hypothetical protein
VGNDKPVEGELVGQLLLGGLGVLLFVAGSWGYFRGPNDKIAGALFVFVGVLLVVLAAFYSHLDGMVELGFLKTPTIKARRAERQVEQGRVVAAHNLEESRRALGEALARYHDAALGTPNFPQHLASGSPYSNGGPPASRNVLLAEDAVFAIATLPPHEQVLVRTEVAQMSRLDFRSDLDLHATRPSDDERAYLMHRVPESGIRLWYRQRSEADPYTLYVVVVEKSV